MGHHSYGGASDGNYHFAGTWKCGRGGDPYHRASRWKPHSGLIAEARKVIEGGVTNILLDLSDLVYISSAGLVALHTIALMTRCV